MHSLHHIGFYHIHSIILRTEFTKVTSFMFVYLKLFGEPAFHLSPIVMTMYDLQVW